MAHIGSKIYHYLAKRCAFVNNQPVIIVGNQKTGSTAIASLLAQAAKVELSQDFLYLLRPSGQDLLFKEHLRFETLVRRNKIHFSKTIIKELDLVFCLEQVLSRFPQGQFVCLIRDPRDNIRSILNRLHLPGNLDALSQEQWNDLPNLAWRDILEGTIYGTEGACYIETLAKRWCRIVEQYDRHKASVHLLRYEDFKQDKVVCIQQLAGQVGLEVKTEIHDAVDVQYQPRGDHQVGWDEFFGETNLLQIERLCGDYMTSYGYPLSR